tara:strand:+ start:941 stop:1186 length:246 start_codon:yes stop_codon:yes gene_type:complete
MKKKLKKISIIKNDQSYIREIINNYPGINSGRRNYNFQYKRVLKNVLLSKLYSKITINRFFIKKNIQFKETNDSISVIINY